MGGGPCESVSVLPRTQYPGKFLADTQGRPYSQSVMTRFGSCPIDGYGGGSRTGRSADDGTNRAGSMP